MKPLAKAAAACFHTALTGKLPTLHLQPQLQFIFVLKANPAVYSNDSKIWPRPAQQWRLQGRKHTNSAAM